uniref:Autotransporter beta-domain-containing protein n=1 Tax=Candidatus Kentrum sp. LPFa TaxID=2126335 RepID=A0A450W4K6_9GAMM|nr:MAG: Autotransporter beta-domain-containing protein [Candidatus Kentron sp. LPFa]
MHSTLERKVFRHGVKPSRRTLERSTLKRALVSGVSVAVTAAMLGMSGQALALDVGASGSTTKSATENLGAVTGTGGSLLINATAQPLTPITMTISSVNMTGAGNITVEASDAISGEVHTSEERSIEVNVGGALKNSGFLLLESKEDDGTGGNIIMTVDGNLTIDDSNAGTSTDKVTLIGNTADTAHSADVVLKLKGDTNKVAGGVILSAKKPGEKGKAILQFAKTGSGAQQFDGTIDGNVDGSGLIDVVGTAGVVFKDKIGATNDVYSMYIGKTTVGRLQNISGTFMKMPANLNATGGTTVTFQDSIFFLDATPSPDNSGITIGDGNAANNDTYTVNFDATTHTATSAASSFKISSIIIGLAGDTSKVILKDGNSNKFIEQTSDRYWQDITELSVQDSITFDSNANITAGTVNLDSGTTSTFNETLTVATELNVQGTATFHNAIQNGSTPAVKIINGNATFNAVNNTTTLSGLTLTGSPTINLGTAIGNGATVFGSNSANATFSDTGAGTVVINIAATGLTSNSEIILLESGSNVAAPDPSKYTINLTAADAPSDTFTVDNGDGTQVRILAKSAAVVVSGQPDLPTIAGITQVSDRMLNHAAAAIAARTGARFSRDAKYAKTGFRATDFYRSRGADDRSFREAGDRGFERTGDRSFREGDDRGVQKMDDRRLREGDERDFGKTDDRRLREGDERKLEKEHERKLDEKRQKAVERPTGVSSGDSVGRAENAWFETFGDWIEQDAKRSSDNAYAVDGYNADIYGFAFGVDTEVTRDTLLGVSFSYSNADVDWEGTSNAAGDVDHYQLTLYGEYRHDKFYAEGMLGYAMNDYEISDFNGGTRKSEFDSNQYLAKLALGVPIYMGNDLFITPKGGLTWTHLDIDNYTQTGTGNLLTVKPNDSESVTATLGAEIHQRIKKNKGYIIPWAYAGVSYDLAGEEASVRARIDTSSYYSLQGIDNEQFAGEVEFGVEYEVGQWSVGAKYAGRYKASRDTHSASLLAEYKF